MVDTCFKNISLSQPSTMEFKNQRKNILPCTVYSRQGGAPSAGVKLIRNVKSVAVANSSASSVRSVCPHRLHLTASSLNRVLQRSNKITRWWNQFTKLQDPVPSYKGGHKKPTLETCPDSFQSFSKLKKNKFHSLQLRASKS